MTVMNCTLASKGRLDMKTTARATSYGSMVGSVKTAPWAWGSPALTAAASGAVSALPMSIWPQAISYLRPSNDVDLVRPVIPCLVAV